MGMSASANRAVRKKIFRSPLARILHEHTDFVHYWPLVWRDGSGGGETGSTVVHIVT